jgi:hypothetical protein
MRKVIDTDYNQLKDTSIVEDILCLSALIATDRIDDSATVIDARNFYDSIGTCDLCPIAPRCLACIINE